MAVFGQSIAAIHLGLLLVNCAAILLVYLLGKRLFGTPRAWRVRRVRAPLRSAPGCWERERTPRTRGGSGARRRAAVDASGRFVGASTLWWSGCCSASAFVMKQQGILFGVFGALYAAARLWRSGEDGRRNGSVFRRRGGALRGNLPDAVAGGVFPKFWFWTFTYAPGIRSEASLGDGFWSFRGELLPILKQNAPLWLLRSGAVRNLAEHENRRRATFVTAFLCFSFLAVCPGLFFRQHYFVAAAAAVALAAGAAIRRRAMCWVFVAALLLSIGLQREFLFGWTHPGMRQLYGPNPFRKPFGWPITSGRTRRGCRIAVWARSGDLLYAHRLRRRPHLHVAD